ncbi:MAG: hypothetical protein AB7F53_06695 [Nitrososphaeraceae archaeon]
MVHCNWSNTAVCFSRYLLMAWGSLGLSYPNAIIAADAAPTK